MQKAKILCLILAVVLASAGTVSFALNMSDDVEAPPIIVDTAVDTVMDKPEGEVPADRSAIENLYIAQGELQRKGGFVGTTRGTAVSAGISQDVYNNRVVIGNNVFKEMITIGIVKNAYQLYISNGNYLHRKFVNITSADKIKWADTAARYSQDDFLDTFGHCSDKLTGYILNDETIVSGVLEKEENGLYTYRYVLDINSAPARMLREMRTNSNMDGYSSFVKAEIVVTMDSDWQIKTLTTDCKYKVPMFGGIDCVESVTETFSDLTSDTLPNAEFFEQFMDAQIETPVDTERTALTVLMDIFAPYISDSNLNVSLNATVDGQTVVDGLVSAKIDIENISNIEVAAKLGNDLFVEYQQGTLYVTYQDFKASTTVDGIMGVVSKLMPSASDNGNVNGGDEEENDILKKFTFTEENGLCTVNLPLDIGDDRLNVNIYANVLDGKYEFRNAEVTFGNMRLTIEPVSAFDMPAREGHYPEILGLLDLVKDGVIYGNVNAFGMDVDVMFDLATTSLYATSGDIALTYQDKAVYAQIGAIKAKLNVDDIDQIVAMLRVAGIINDETSLEMPTVSLDEIVSMLGDIRATSTGEGVVFSLNADELSVAVYLATTSNGWNIDKLTVGYKGNVITLAMTEPTIDRIPEVNADEYADAVELIATFVEPIVSIVTTDCYGANFAFDVTVDNVTYKIKGAFAYDAAKNINVVATVSNGVATVLKANVTVSSGAVYLDVNGIKAAFALDKTNDGLDFAAILGAIYGVNPAVDSAIDALAGVVDKVINLDIESIDFTNIVKKFAFSNGTLALTVNADFVGLGDIDVALSVNRKGNLVVDVRNLQLGDVALGIDATVLTKVAAVTVPDVNDYVLNLAGNVEGIGFVVSADLYNMDICANVEALGQNIAVRYVDDKLYAAVGEVALVCNIDQIGAFAAKIADLIGADTMSMPALPDIDLSVRSLLDAITFDISGAAPVIAIELDGFANVNVNFDNEANFAGITATVMGVQLEVAATDTQASKLDLNRTYIPVVSLADQLVNVYNNYKDVLNTGIALNVNATVDIDGNVYFVNANVNYNSGLYVNATVADNLNKLIVADVYFVNNALYLDVNGVRIATELPVAALSDNANVNVFETLSQLKGYNGVLDSVINIITQLPDKLDGINYLDLLGSLTYDNGVLSATVNGSLLGLSDFDVTVAGERDVTLTIANLAIGKCAIDSLTLNAVPACEEITAPAAEYVTEIELEAMGLTITAKLDLYNKAVTAYTTLLNHELAIYYVDGAIFATYDGIYATLGIEDIARLLDVINTFVTVEIPETNFDIEVKSILESVAIASTEDGAKLSVAVGDITIEAAFDSDARLANAQVAVGEINVNAKIINGATYPEFDATANYCNIADVVELYAGEIKNLLDAEGYGVTLNGQFAFGNHVYDVIANVNYNLGLYVNANVTYNTVNIVDVQLWYVDDALYAQLGDTRFAVKLNGDNALGSTGNFNLAQLKGYNAYLDGVLEVIQNVIDKVEANRVDYNNILGGIAYDNGNLTVDVNGAVLGLSQMRLQLAANNGIAVAVSNVVLGDLTANFNANVVASKSQVTAPLGDFTTNLSVKIDDVNTVYANLDLINGVYNFKLDDMFVQYSNSIVKVNKGNTYLSGDVNKIVEMVRRIDELVNEFSGATESTMSKIDLSVFDNIDIKAIVNSLSITTVGNAAALSVSALGFDVNVMLAHGGISRITVPVDMIGKTLEITLCDKQQYCEFGEDIDYVAIEQVFEDYFPVFEKLVHTNSWKFSFDGDTMLSMGQDNYKVAAGSYFEFYYKNTEGFDTFKLRAHLDVHKFKGNDVWQEFMLLDIVYKDGNVYVSDTGRKVGNNGRNTIKLTVSVDSVVKCFGLYDDLVKVVPQIGELVENMKSAMAEAEGNADKLSYSNILTEATYVNGIFGLALNGNALLSKLGDVTLSAQTEGEGLSMDDLELHYDTISVKVCNLRVYADENVVDDIDEYDTTGHMDFNSLYELLSAFVKTATPADESGVRSFYVDGTALVNLHLGKLDLAELPIGLAVKVDITADNEVYISAKIHRTEPSGAMLNLVSAFGGKVYNDKGGDSYLYYDGVNDTFTVVRNSVQSHNYCSICNNYNCSKKTLHTAWRKDKNIIDTEFYGYPSYRVDNLSSADFTANIMDYIMEMFNFGSLIKDPIVDAMNKENTNDFGIEDIFKDYSYSADTSTFAVKADLAAIDSNLGAVDVTILHAEDYSLTNLNVNVALLNGMCEATVPFELKPSVYGEATSIVKEILYW